MRTDSISFIGKINMFLEKCLEYSINPKNYYIKKKKLITSIIKTNTIFLPVIQNKRYK